MTTPVAESAAVRFPCFGATVSVEVVAENAELLARRAAEVAMDLHRSLTRFDPDSDLCRLNRDPSPTVAAEPAVLALASAVRRAGEMSGGLVDATCVDHLERAGYTRTIEDLAPAPERLAAPRGSERTAVPDPDARWRSVRVDEGAGVVHRPPGVRLDSGGLGKGLAADLMAAGLDDCAAFSVDCGGDIRIGGAWDDGGRLVAIASPLHGAPPLAEFRAGPVALATSGIGFRTWAGPGGRPAHHLIDPGRGIPADTGVVQVTAIARTALDAEIRAKAALLSGPGEGERHLPEGGWMVLRDGRVMTAPSSPACEIRREVTE